jgi:hypothetical protein
VTVIDDSTIIQRQLGDVSTVIDVHLGHRPVYLVRLSYDLPALEQRYVLRPVPGVVGGEVFQVEGRRALARGAYL